MSTLYEITGDLLEVQEMLESGEYTEEELADTLESLQFDLGTKADSYARVIRNLEGSAEALHSEIDRLLAKETAAKLGIKRMKTALQMAMTTAGQKKIKTDLFSFTVRKNGGLAPLVLDKDPSDMPETFRKVSYSANTSAIRDFIKEHGECEYGHLEERGESLVIK